MKKRKGTGKALGMFLSVLAVLTAACSNGGGGGDTSIIGKRP
jgi:hypothetical protein